MKLLHWLATFALVAFAAAEVITPQDMLNDIDTIDARYKECAKYKEKLGSDPLSGPMKIMLCVTRPADEIASAYTRLPHIDRGETPMDLGTCSDIATALKKPFQSGKVVWEILNDKKLICLFRRKEGAEAIKERMEQTVELWEKSYLPRYRANCDKDAGSVDFAYQEWQTQKDALTAAIAAWGAWETTCAS